MMSDRPSARSTAKMNAEKRLVKQRDKEHEYHKTWSDRAQYYQTWEKRNNQFEGWTSPRYYESNNQTIETYKKKRDHEDNLHKRREKLRALLAEEERSYEIEMMVKNRHVYEKPSVPTEVLKTINIGIKRAEEDRKRHEAELSLYHQWRNNNPVLREHERAITDRNLKLSWLDQQVDKRLQQEKDEEECRAILKERNKRIEQENAREEQIQRETTEKNQQLQADLEKQMQELRVKQDKSKELRLDEEENAKKLAELARLQEQQSQLNQQLVERELALENLKQHKLKLKQSTINIRNNLEQEQTMIKQLIETDLIDKMADDAKKLEVRKTMHEYLQFTREQQELEKKREKHFNFIFDSEAKSIYDKQREIWTSEQIARNELLKDVLDTIKQQIEEKNKLTKEKQRETLQEREAILKLVEEYESDANKVKLEEQRKRDEWKSEVDEQIKEKRARNREAKLKEQREVDLELEAARKEEERLRKEIMKLQQRCGPIRPPRSRILF